MTLRIKEVGTVELVSDRNRRYDEDCADRARRIIREFVDQAGTETIAARLLGVHQSTINNNLNPTKQPTLRVLIPLSKKLGRTIDDILGIGPPPSLNEEAIAERVARRVEERLGRAPTTRPPASVQRASSAPKK